MGLPTAHPRQQERGDLLCGLAEVVDRRPDLAFGEVADLSALRRLLGLRAPPFMSREAKTQPPIRAWMMAMSARHLAALSDEHPVAAYSLRTNVAVRVAAGAKLLCGGAGGAGRRRSMMTRTRLLSVDAVINLVLGVALLAFPIGLVEALGFPASDSDFYPTVLGAVLFGIGVSLGLEARSARPASGGLGLMGAVSINVSAAIVISLWLLFGDLALQPHGVALLVVLILTLIGLSWCEWYVLRRDRGDPPTRAVGRD